MTSTLSLLGRQTFDGLGRQRSIDVAGRVTRYHYQPGQLLPTANTLADGSRLAFTYAPQLDNALLAIEAEGQPAERLTYHPTLGVPCQADGELGSQDWTFTPSGRLLQETWRVDGEAYSSRWQHSLQGKLQGFIASNGVEHACQYDEVGRLSLLRAGDIQTRYTYDAFSRPRVLITEDTSSAMRLTRTFGYDAMGRTSSISFEALAGEQSHSLTQSLAYSALDQLTSRIWKDGEHASEEHFEYDLRGRLTRYTVSPETNVTDPFGNTLVEQRFTYDAVDGVREVLSTFADGSQDQAVYHSAEHDPTQVAAISHSHTTWPARIELEYDACGRLIADSLGRKLQWSAQDRLLSVTLDERTCRYGYTPSGQPSDRIVDGNLQRSFFSGAQLTHEQHGDQQLALAGDGSHLFALTRIADEVKKTTLLGCDGQGSVRLQLNDQMQVRHYSPHGNSPENQHVPFGFTGERREPLTGWYIANGYRPYDPLLMIFLAPDSESPFGRGGINPYAYCGGDPVNRVDPDGHSWVTWAVSGIGLGLGAAATVASLGTALPAVAALVGGSGLSASAALAISSAALNLVSLGTGAAAMALEASGKDRQAASVLGWISLGSGIAGALTAMAPKLAQQAMRLRHAPVRATSQSASFQPYHIGPGGSARPASVLYGQARHTADVAFVPSLFGEGDAALMTHGNLLGNLMNTQGLADDAVEVARSILVPRLAEMGYAEGRKIVLVACWGGRSGAAQAIADALGRPVQAYGEKLFVKSLASLQSTRAIGHTMQSTNVPVCKVSAWQRWFGTAQFSDAPQYRVAIPTLYHPR